MKENDIVSKANVILSHVSACIKRGSQGSEMINGSDAEQQLDSKTAVISV